MSDTAKSPLPFRWLLVCLLPLLTAVYFHFFPAVPGSSGFLIKYVLFALVTHHLKGEFAYRRQTALLFLPLILLVIYIFYYFGAF